MYARPLLSIVVPTRNRSEYAIPTVSALLDAFDDDVEVVVEDNSSDRSLAEWVGRLADRHNLQYHWSPEPRSMTENYEHAITRARGLYVCMIGDDDGVNPDIVVAAKWAHQHGIEALVPSGVAQYVWPDLVMRSSQALRPGELRLRFFTGALEVVDPEAELRRCIASAGQSFVGLPRVYYGVVQRSCLERVRSRVGRCFPGISPDIAGAIALGATARKVVRVDYPLFVPGSSLNSNAGRSGLRRHVGLLRDQSHLPSDCELNWSPEVPPFYSIETVWAEAALSALRAASRDDLLHTFDVFGLYAACLMWHPEFAPIILRQLPKSLRQLGIGLGEGIARLVSHFASLGLLRARALVSRRRNRATIPNELRLAGLRDVGSAVAAARSHIEERGLTFGQLVTEEQTNAIVHSLAAPGASSFECLTAQQAGSQDR